MILKAFFDEAGHVSDPDTRAFAIGGGIATLEQWERLEEEWSAVLSKFGVSKFHATDYFASRKEFKGWNTEENKNKRRSFITALLRVIKQYVAKPIGVVLPLVAFRSLSPADQSGLISPYHLCLQACFGEVGLEAHGLGAEGKVQLVFARVEGFVGKAAELHNAFIEHSSHPLRHYLGGISFDSPADTIPLQAADMIAYEFAHELERTADRKPRRGPMRVLFSMRPNITYLPPSEIRAGLP